MSTPSERLEAQVWLEATLPDLPRHLREQFFTGVDEYYTQYPTADRGPDILATLEDDNEAFAQILRAVLPDGAARDALVAAVLDTPTH